MPLPPLLRSVLVVSFFWHIVHYLEARSVFPPGHQGLPPCCPSYSPPPPRPAPLQDHVNGNPLMMGFYPFIGVASIVATLPFLMYITMAGEFGRLHPLHPRDYAFLLGRLGGAARSNNMKVSAKEL